jgi:SAM-dependent methyltransferase
MDKFTQANQDLWNELVPIHAASELYNLKGFKAGESTLSPIDLEEVGDVAGKSLLHLQCHFGLDTLSWARLGARVTGVDFSEKAITLARSLSRELGIEAQFICADVYDLPRVLEEQFDIVYTSGGVLCWLKDLGAWAGIIARHLKPGGIFYLRDSHPFLNVFDNERETTELTVRYSYFHKTAPMRWRPNGSYADPSAKVQNPSFEWTHSLGDIVNSLTAAGLRIEFLHEFPFLFYEHFSFMEKGADGAWRLKGKENTIPLMFSLRAMKTGA